jgi:hypothetical protein
MKRWIMAVLVAIVVGLAGLATAPVCVSGNGCGIKPIKPIPPIGCKDLVARCQCDAKGKNCVWVWDCVPR